MPKIGIYVFILIGLIVGVCIDLLIRWQCTTPFYYVFISAIGYLYALAFNGKNNSMLLATSFITALVLSIPFIGINWVGWDINHSHHFLLFLCAAPIFLYVGHCFHYACHHDDSWQPTYVTLFAAVWNTIVLLIVASIFSMIGNLLITLGAWVFKSTGNDYLWELYKNRDFHIILDVTLFYIGIGIGQQNIGIIYSIRLILLKMMYYLFPIVAIISIIFLPLHLVQLLSGGIAPVNPLVILVPLVILGIIFFNAYYQDGDTETIPPTWLNSLFRIYRVVLFILAVMMVYHLFKEFPINSNLLLYLVCTLLLTITYAISAYLSKDEEKQWIRKGNVSIALFFLIMTFLMNIPYLPLDFTIGEQAPKLTPAQQNFMY